MKVATKRTQVALVIREVIQASDGGGRRACGHGWGGVGQPHLLTAQLALIFSLGTVPVEVAGLPELEDCPVPASEGTLQGHLGARGCSWKAHRDTRHWSAWVAPWEGCGESIPPMPFTSQGLRQPHFNLAKTRVSTRRLRGNQSPNPPAPWLRCE